MKDLKSLDAAFVIDTFLGKAGQHRGRHRNFVARLRELPALGSGSR